VSINLQKGDRIDLAKEDPNLKRVAVALGWDENNTNSGAEFDLDASAFMLNANGKIPSEKFFVFYKNLTSLDEAVKHTGDNLTGGKGDNKTDHVEFGKDDNETIHVEFGKLDSRIVEIPVVVTIYDAATRKQNFGMVNNAFIRLYNVDTKKEICRYDLSENFQRETAIEFGRLYKKDGAWKFRPVGQGYNDGLDGFVNMFYEGN